MLHALVLLAAHAQVNAENLAAAATADGFGLALSSGTALAVGNVSLLDVHGDAAAQLRSSRPDGLGGRPWMRDRLILSLHGAYRTVAQTPILDERLAHLRGTHMFVPRWGVDAFVQAQNDRSLLLDWRLVAGGGLRFVVAEDDRLGLWGGSGTMAELELRNVSPPDATEVLNYRWTTYLSWRAVLVPDHLNWSNTAYVQPRIDDFGDVQIVDEGALEAPITRALAMSSSARLRYDSRAPADLRALDLRWITGLTFRWAARPDPAPPE